MQSDSASDGEVNESNISTSSISPTPTCEGRAASLLNLRIGQPKGPMWSLLCCDGKKVFKSGSKVSHMVTCIGFVLYSEESLYYNSPSRLLMVDSLVRSNETYDPNVHDQIYDLKDDWTPQPTAKNIKKAGKNTLGTRGITHVGSCTLVKVNSAQTNKIINHLLNVCPFRMKINERYPVQVSRLVQSVIGTPPPRKKRYSEYTTTSGSQIVSSTFVDDSDTAHTGNVIVSCD